MHSRVAYFLPLFAALFLFGFCANIANDELTLGDSVIQWGVAVTLMGLFVLVRREERRRLRFLEYLAANREAIRAGTAIYDGQTLGYATRVHVYHLVLSFLVVSIKLPSRLTLRSGADLRLRAGYSLVSALFGWWGIPWGPLWTVQSIVNNFRRRPEFTIGEMLEGKASISVPQAIQRSASTRV